VSNLTSLGFAAVSTAAREGHVTETAALYRAFRDYTDDYLDDDEIRKSRALVCWNVLMCYVDRGQEDDESLDVLDDIAVLAREYGADDPDYVVEHGKCAIELTAALWNSGRDRDAAAVARSAESSLRSKAYLQARERDIGEPPEQFLETLDMILQADEAGRP
jgi:hypothetical protein